MVTPPGWVEVRNGEVRSFKSPGGDGCVLRYCERLSPIRSLRSLVRASLAAHPGFRPASLGPPQRLRTAEGEYAALVTVRGSGTDGASPTVALIVGAIFAEDFSTLLEAEVSRDSDVPIYQAELAKMLAADELALGVRRRRYYFYTPTGWRQVRDGLNVLLYPPDYPEPHAYIRLEPADPRRERDPLQLLAAEDAQHGLRPMLPRDGFAVPPPTSISTQHGLLGEISCTYNMAPHGETLVRHLVVLRDSVYHYVLRLEALAAEVLPQHLDVLCKLADTIEPIAEAAPQDPSAPSEGVTPAGLWVE